SISRREPGVVVPMPTLPAKYAFPVVVAPPLTVRPPVCVPLPMVDEAWKILPPVKVLLPVNVLKSPSNVEDAAVPPVIAPQIMWPDASVCSAFVVPQTPNRPSVVVPVLETLNKVVVPVCVEEPMAKRVVLVEPFTACTESCANGELVPTPKL